MMDYFFDILKLHTSPLNVGCSERASKTNFPIFSGKQYTNDLNFHLRLQTIRKWFLYVLKL